MQYASGSDYSIAEEELPLLNDDANTTCIFYSDEDLPLVIYIPF